MKKLLLSISTAALLSGAHVASASTTVEEPFGPQNPGMGSSSIPSATPEYFETSFELGEEIGASEEEVKPKSPQQPTQEPKDTSPFGVMLKNSKKGGFRGKKASGISARINADDYDAPAAKPAPMASATMETVEEAVTVKPAPVTKATMETEEETVSVKPAPVTTATMETEEETVSIKPAPVTTATMETEEETVSVKPAPVTSATMETEEETIVTSPAPQQKAPGVYPATFHADTYLNDFAHVRDEAKAAGRELGTYAWEHFQKYKPHFAALNNPKYYSAEAAPKKEAGFDAVRYLAKWTFVRDEAKAKNIAPEVYAHQHFMLNKKKFPNLADF